MKQLGRKYYRTRKVSAEFMSVVDSVSALSDLSLVDKNKCQVCLSIMLHNSLGMHYLGSKTDSQFLNSSSEKNSGLTMSSAAFQRSQNRRIIFNINTNC